MRHNASVTFSKPLETNPTRIAARDFLRKIMERDFSWKHFLHLNRFAPGSGFQIARSVASATPAKSLSPRWASRSGSGKPHSTYTFLKANTSHRRGGPHDGGWN